MKKTQSVFGILLLLTIAMAVIYAAHGIVSILTSPFTSFPWYAACEFAALYFGPVILLELLVYTVLRCINRRRENCAHEEER